jgi:hypothetical protein
VLIALAADRRSAPEHPCKHCVRSRFAVSSRGRLLRGGRLGRGASCLGKPGDDGYRGTRPTAAAGRISCRTGTPTSARGGLEGEADPDRDGVPAPVSSSPVGSIYMHRGGVRPC